MDTVCDNVDPGLNVRYEEFTDLPNSNPTKALPAYVVGTFNGRSMIQESQPFLITSNDLVVASGNTWTLNDRPIFFALVEPVFVRQEDWNPKAWLVEGRECFGEIQ